MEDETDLITLLPGLTAPTGADHIRIEPLPDGRFRWLGLVVSGQLVAFTEGERDSFDEAKLAAYHWAKDQGAQLVYLEDGRS